jgi:hypothetical protein
VVWHDIYTLIINLFLERHPDYVNNGAYAGVLTRKTLKTVIMIVNYNAGKKECYRQFTEALKEQGLYSHSTNYFDFCDKFHDFVSTDLFERLYVGSRSSLLNTANYSYTFSDAKVNLGYLDSTIKQEIIKVDKVR